MSTLGWSVYLIILYYSKAIKYMRRFCLKAFSTKTTQLKMFYQSKSGLHRLAVFDYFPFLFVKGEAPATVLRRFTHCFIGFRYHQPFFRFKLHSCNRSKTKDRQYVRSKFVENSKLLSKTKIKYL